MGGERPPGLPDPERPEAVLAALGDPVRRRIVSLLASGALPVGAIAEHFAISRPAISRHLRVLLEAGVAGRERAGQKRLYRVERAALEELGRWVEALRERLPAEGGQDRDAGVEERPGAPGKRGAGDWRCW
jgi:DNA-binding transcriptional ArsR family regulator